MVFCISIPFCLSLIFMLSIEAVHTKHLRAHKNFKHDNGNGDGKASRTNLLWDLILTGKSSSHKGRSSSRHLHMTQQKQRHQDYATQKQLYEGSKNSYNNNLEVQTVPLDVGLCSDQHPMCASYALNGLCDWPGLFQNLDNTHKTCAFSCGNCKENIPNGEVDFVGAGWNGA